MKFRNKIYPAFLFPFSICKGSVFLKNRHFIVIERFNNLIYGVNTIMKCGTRQPVKFQLVSRSWNEMSFYRISELMLGKLIQRHDKNLFTFDPVQKRETNWNFTGSQMAYFMIALILYKNLSNFFWIKKMSIFEEYGAFNMCKYLGQIRCPIFFFSHLYKIFHVRNATPHDNTSKSTSARREDSDQPGHPPSLIRAFAVRMKKAWVLSDPLNILYSLWSDWANAQADLSPLDENAIVLVLFWGGSNFE